MNITKSSPRRHVSEREALRKRVRRFYEWFNREFWEKCFSLIDPKLTEAAKVHLNEYADRLQEFKKVYGGVKPWHVRISLHLESSNKHDKRPFAYVYLVWQDDAHEFHMFRERWVIDSGRWFTRVVGLVPNNKQSVKTPD